MINSLIPHILHWPRLTPRAEFRVGFVNRVQGYGCGTYYGNSNGDSYVRDKRQQGGDGLGRGYAFGLDQTTGGGCGDGINHGHGDGDGSGNSTSG